MPDLFEGTEIISADTRAQAIEDRTPTDVSEIASEIGYIIPVAIAPHAWADVIADDPADHDSMTETEATRVHEVLTAAQEPSRKIGPFGDQRATFTIQRPNATGEPEPIYMIIHVGPGHDARPLATIMRPLDYGTR
ncbi:MULTISPECIES: DUF6573 family protein [Nocardia]|uniref:DUF6573 family protein n=1 Tax=Nocardia TaxID=1817 RepID=UPI002454C5DC|nr:MULTISPECIES: DUF6573 family protein [Nocardia]